MYAAELKFADIVARAGIDRWTGQYCLKHPEHLAGMPRAGVQGAHRRFTVEQALKLVICVELVKAGLALEQAGLAVKHCTETYRNWPESAFPGGTKPPLYRGAPGNPWLVEVVNRQYVRLVRRKQSPTDQHLTIGMFYSLTEGRLATEDVPPEIEYARTLVQINASAYRMDLERTTE